MTLKAHLRTVLKGNEYLATKLGERIYSGRFPKDPVSPYLMVIETKMHPEHHMRGPEKTKKVDVQISSMSANSDENGEITQAIIDTLDGYSGTSSGITIKTCLAFDCYDDTWSDDVGLHRRVVEFEILLTSTK